MGWRKEFGEEYQVPQDIEDLTKHGVTRDLSWHNDSSPSFGFVRDVVGKPHLDIRLWVEHPDVDKREFGPDSSRYGVQVFGDDKVLDSKSFRTPQPAIKFYKEMLIKHLDTSDLPRHG